MNKTKSIKFIIYILICFTLKLQNQNYSIVSLNKISTEHQEEIVKMVFNKDGSYYICGHNGGQITIQDITQQQTSEHGSIFLAYFNKNDKCVWIKTFGSDYVDYVKSLCVDDNKNVYLVGAFSGNSMVFDNITLNNTRPWYYDLFVVKVSSTGQVLWAKGNDLIFSYPVMDDEAIIDCATDINNNIVVVGFSKSTNYNYINSFIAKISNDGNKKWIKYIQSDGYKIISSCYVNNDDYIYIAGAYMGNSLVMDNIILPSCNSYQNGFLAKLDSSGNCLHAKNISNISIPVIGGTQQQYLLNFSKNIFVKSFNSKKILLAAQILEGANASIDSIIFNNITNSPYPCNFLIAELDSSFNVNWGRTSSSYINTYINDLVFDSSGNIFICGNVNGKVLYYNNQVTMGHYISDGSSAYIACLDSSGYFMWGYLSRNIDLSETLSGEYNYGITCAAYDNKLLMGGNFYSDTIFFGNSCLSNTTYSFFYQGFYGYANSSDIYLLKLSKGNNVNELLNEELLIYPNPVKNEIFISKNDPSNKIERVMLTSVYGKVIYLWSDVNDHIMLPVKIQNGLYILNVQTKYNTISYKLLINK